MLMEEPDPNLETPIFDESILSLKEYKIPGWGELMVYVTDCPTTTEVVEGLITGVTGAVQVIVTDALQITSFLEGSVIPIVNIPPA